MFSSFDSISQVLILCIEVLVPLARLLVTWRPLFLALSLLEIKALMLKQFLLTCYNVIVRGKNVEGKDACLFAFLDKKARIAYRTKFIVGWSEY